MQPQQEAASSRSAQPTWQQAELAVQPQAMPMQPMQQPPPMQPIFMPSDHPQAEPMFAAPAASNPAVYPPPVGNLAPANSVPADAALFQLEIPTSDGCPYGRNWAWLAADSAGVGTLVYDGPSIWRRMWNTILSVFVMLHLRNGPAPTVSRIEFQDWSAIHSQKVCSVFLSRVDYIGLEYLSLYSASLRSHIPALRPESHVAGVLSSIRAMFDSLLDSWMKWIMRAMEVLFQNDLGFGGLCALCALICVICCFLSVGSEGRPAAMTAALVFSIFLLVLALCGTVWTLESKRTEATTPHHVGVARPAHVKLMRCWVALCVLSFALLLCCAIFVGDWNANGPDAKKSSSSQPDHVGTSGSGTQVGFYRWSASEKFVCANWDRSTNSYLPYRESPDLGSTSSDSSSPPHTMCSDTERGTVVAGLIFALFALVVCLLILAYTAAPRVERKALYARVTLFGAWQHGLPISVLLDATTAHQLQMQFLHLTQGRYKSEVGRGDWQRGLESRVKRE